MQTYIERGTILKNYADQEIYSNGGFFQDGRSTKHYFLGFHEIGCKNLLFSTNVPWVVLFHNKGLSTIIMEDSMAFFFNILP